MQNLKVFAFATVRDTIVLVASPDSQKRQANVHPVASLADLNGYSTRLRDTVEQDLRSSRTLTPCRTGSLYRI